MTRMKQSGIIEIIHISEEIEEGSWEVFVKEEKSSLHYVCNSFKTSLTHSPEENMIFTPKLNSSS